MLSEKKANKCDGCKKQCAFDIIEHYNGYLTSFWPTIGGIPLEDFCDTNNITLTRTEDQRYTSWRDLRSRNIWFGLLTENSALNLARDIATLCRYNRKKNHTR